MENGMEQSIAKLVMMNCEMKYKNTTREDISINYPDGELVIKKLRYEDAGIYKCRFTGSRDKSVTLLVTGEFVLYCFMAYGWLIDWSLIDWESQTAADMSYCNIVQQMYAIIVLHG